MWHAAFVLAFATADHALAFSVGGQRVLCPRLKTTTAGSNGKNARQTLLRLMVPGMEASTSLVIAESIEGIRQYVPLFTCSMVLLDIALGRPVVNGIARKLFAPSEGAVEPGGFDPDSLLKNAVFQEPKENKLTGDARVDMEKVTAEAEKKASDVLMRIDYAEKVRPKKGTVEEAKKRLARQFEELN